MFKDLASQDQMYGHVRVFSHVTVKPGWSLGRHGHDRETEFYYILKGTPILDDNGTELELPPGDVAATGNGEVHALYNPTDSDVELIALIVLQDGAPTETLPEQ